MNRKEYLRLVRKQILFVFDRDSIETELEQHLCDSIHDLVEEGLSVEEAEIQAVEQMGDPIEVGKLLNQEHHPLLGYLWMASRTVLILLMIPAVYMMILFGYNIIQLASPTTIDNCVETKRVDMNLDISTHKVKIDNICIDDENRYYITYRSWIKFDYSRAGWSSELFDIRGSDEKDLFKGGYQSASFIGNYGCKEFYYPDDDILCLVSEDGKIIEMNLKEYFYE